MVHRRGGCYRGSNNLMIASVCLTLPKNPLQLASTGGDTTNFRTKLLQLEHVQVCK